MKKAIILSTVFLLLFSLGAFALTATISNPKMIIYKNVTPDVPLVFDNYVGVINRNDFPVKIKAEPIGDLTDIVKINDSEFVLEAGESKDIHYTVTITKPKIYKGDVVVKFNKLDQNLGAGLAQTLVIIVEGQGDFTNVSNSPITGNVAATDSTAKPNPLVGLLIFLIIVVMGVIIYFIIIAVGGKK